MLCDFSQPSWPIMFVNQNWEKQTGVENDKAASSSFWDHFEVRMPVLVPHCHFSRCFYLDTAWLGTKSVTGGLAHAYGS